MFMRTTQPGPQAKVPRIVARAAMRGRLATSLRRILAGYDTSVQGADPK